VAIQRGGNSKINVDIVVHGTGWADVVGVAGSGAYPVMNGKIYHDPNQKVVPSFTDFQVEFIPMRDGVLHEHKAPTIYTGIGSAELRQYEDVLIINRLSGAATAITLNQKVLEWGKPYIIKDGKGDANSYNIALALVDNDIITYDQQTAEFSIGDIITGTTSDATAEIVAIKDVGSTGTLILKNISGTFSFKEDREGSLSNPFSSTAGSAVISVAHTAHKHQVGETVTFSGAAASPVDGMNINGAYTVTGVTDADNYTITHGVTATNSEASFGGTVGWVKIPKLTNPFSSTAGSAVISVAHTAHGLEAGQPALFDNATASPTDGLTIDGHYTVTGVTDADNYTITHGVTATNSEASFGGTVDWEYKEFITGAQGGSARTNSALDTTAGLIDGSSSYVINTNYGAATIVTNGADAWVLSRYE